MIYLFLAAGNGVRFDNLFGFVDRYTIIHFDHIVHENNALFFEPESSSFDLVLNFMKCRLRILSYFRPNVKVRRNEFCRKLKPQFFQIRFLLGSLLVSEVSSPLVKSDYIYIGVSH